MCECGCVMIPYQWKLRAADGSFYVFRVYSSCRNCSAPAGVDYARVLPGDDHFWEDAKALPDLPVDDRYGIGGIAVVGIDEMRKRIRESLIGTDLKDTAGVIDDVWAEQLAEEAVPDLRETVYATRKACEAR